MTSPLSDDGFFEFLRALSERMLVDAAGRWRRDGCMTWDGVSQCARPIAYRFAMACRGEFIRNSQSCAECYQLILDEKLSCCQHRGTEQHPVQVLRLLNDDEPTWTQEELREAGLLEEPEA